MNNTKTKKAFGYEFTFWKGDFMPLNQTWFEIAKEVKNPKGNYFRQGKIISLEGNNQTYYPIRVIGFQYANVSSEKRPEFAFIITSTGKRFIKL